MCYRQRGVPTAAQVIPPRRGSGGAEPRGGVSHLLAAARKAGDAPGGAHVQARPGLGRDARY